MRITLAGVRDFHACADRLRAAGKGLKRDLGEGLRKPTKDAAQTIRDKILQADMAGFRKPGAEPFLAHIPSRGVKRPTARAVQGEVKVDGPEPRAIIVLRIAEIPQRIRQLIAYWVGKRKRLRHPVMGNKHAWVGQRIPNVWEIPNKPAFRKAVKDVLDNIPRKVRR